MEYVITRAYCESDATPVSFFVIPVGHLKNLTTKFDVVDAIDEGINSFHAIELFNQHGVWYDYYEELQVLWEDTGFSHPELATVSIENTEEMDQAGIDCRSVHVTTHEVRFEGRYGDLRVESHDIPRSIIESL